MSGGAFKAQVFYKFHHEHGGRADRIFVLSEKAGHKVSNRQFKPIDSVLIVELRLIAYSLQEKKPAIKFEEKPGSDTQLALFC